jgi:hypothetical protein
MGSVGSVPLSVELDQCRSSYGTVHRAGCRDLSDGLEVGIARTRDEADQLVEDETGWERPYRYAPCVRLHG